jgi:hypothetical protein
MFIHKFGCHESYFIMWKKWHIKLSMLGKYWLIMHNIILRSLITSSYSYPKKIQNNIIIVIKIFHHCGRKFHPCKQSIFATYIKIFCPCGKNIMYMKKIFQKYSLCSQKLGSPIHYSCSQVHISCLCV